LVCTGAAFFAGGALFAALAVGGSVSGAGGRDAVFFAGGSVLLRFDWKKPLFVDESSRSAKKCEIFPAVAS
jgi:hypothetical protein